MSGYSDPMGEPVSPTAQNPRLRAANNPYLILKHDLAQQTPGAVIASNACALVTNDLVARAQALLNFTLFNSRRTYFSPTV